MNTNLNQLLKDLEIGPAYVKILICLLGCTFMLYPTFFHFTCFFRELSVYEQVLFTSRGYKSARHARFRAGSRESHRRSALSAQVSRQTSPG